MKRTLLNISLFFVSLGLLFTSCEDFLDTETTNQKLTSNYPATPNDASQLLTGAYAVLSGMNYMNNPFLIAELRSDDRLGGGGTGTDISTKAIAQFQKWNESGFANGWQTLYKGVFRSNYLLENSQKVKWENETQQNTIEGEAHYLRAHYYFELSRLFGDVCLLKGSESVNVPRSPAAETYAFIAADLKTAIERLPAIKYSETEKGRATKWSAEALLARVFLFYTGYYNQETLPLEGGGAITKQQVADWLVDCIEHSGHDLVSDFRNLWPYSYVQDYAFTSDNGLKWEGDGNKETVFAIKYSTNMTGNAQWDAPYQLSNQICLAFGLRDPNNDLLTFPFGYGWGFGTVNPNTWNEWSDADIRKRGSVFCTTDRTEIRNFQLGDQADATTYFQKKYIPINVHNETGGTWNYSIELYGNTIKEKQLNNTQDLILMRFADVLLMAAEVGAPNAQLYLDRIRTRAGLPSVPPTLENIKAERRFELAFEGIRYFDLLRWHDEDQLTQNQKDIPIVLPRGESTTKTIVYRPETGGFLQIPASEIELSKNVLTPNLGWGPEATYQP